MSRDRWSLVAVVATMVVWGLNFPFVKYVLDQIGVGAFLFIRFAALPLLGLALLAIVFRGRLARTWPRREDLPRFILCALVGHTVHIAAVMSGMNLSTAFSSSLVLMSGPLFTLVILAALGAERLGARQIAGTLLACAGIALFLSEKFAGGAAHAGYGDLLLIVAALCFSLYTVLAQPITKRYGPLIVLSYTLLFSAPPILLLNFGAFLRIDPAKLTPLVCLGMFWALVLSSFLGWMAWGWANAVRGVARCAPFNYLMPPIAGFSAWLTLGESFTWLKVLGAAVTMAGVAWAQFGAGRPPPREAAQPDSA
ncbi:MAG TPA: DMT family transporter [Burkholderiales bacterium]|nr:DMT family transporter [Burkholderiales bacterium]